MQGYIIIISFRKHVYCIAWNAQRSVLLGGRRVREARGAGRNGRRPTVPLPPAARFASCRMPPRTAFSLRPSGRCHVSVIVRSSPLFPFEPRSIVIFILRLICIQLAEQTLLYGLQCSMDCSDLRLDFNKFVNSAITVFVTPAWIKPINEKLLVFHITLNEFTSGSVLVTVVINVCLTKC